MGEKTGAIKKEGESHVKHESKPEVAKSKGKHQEPVAGACHSWGCKASAHRFNFCNDHFDHFKFGLIKKTGEPVTDYEKKFEHFVAWKTKQRAHKVA